MDSVGDSVVRDPKDRAAYAKQETGEGRYPSGTLTETYKCG